VAHVAAYLVQRDLSAFDPCAVPRQTTAFFEIVNVGQAPENAELADAPDELKLPDICSLVAIVKTACGATLEWLLDRRRQLSIPYRSIVAPGRDPPLRASVSARTLRLYRLP